MSRSALRPPDGVTPPSRIRLTAYAERELAAIDDACRLAELWESALRASFQLGYGSGYDRGAPRAAEKRVPPGRRSSPATPQ